METLEERYSRLCQTPSSINEHLPTLRALACELFHVVEFGVDIGQSTTAFLLSSVKHLTSVDIVIKQEVLDLYSSYRARPSPEWRLLMKNDLDMDPIPCDLLFIDTWHAYPQLRSELSLHADYAGKYIALHDTMSFQWKGEGWQDWEAAGRGKLLGLWPAVEEFLREHREWEIRNHYPNNNGLTIMARKSPS